MVARPRLLKLLVLGATGAYAASLAHFVRAFSTRVRQDVVARRRQFGVSHMVGTSSASTDPTPQKRKARTNKYKKFSKIDELLDPQEKLIADSERMARTLVEESLEAARKQKAPPQLAPLPSIEFPDTKNIDPYDPQTFGYIEIGSVVGAHGVHGWLKVRSTTDFPTERLCRAGVRHVKAANKRAPRQVVLLQGKQCHGDEYLVQLDQIDNRDAAHKFRGAILYVRVEQRDDANEKGQDEYLVSDLVGLDVFLEPQEGDSDKKHVGIVGGVVFAEDICSIPGLGHDYLELVLPRGVGGASSFRDKMVLIPLVPQLVPFVDVMARTIHINPPDGLLDLTYVREDKTRIKGFLPPARN